MSHSVSGETKPDSRKQPTARGKGPLIAVILVCAAPFIAAWLAYFVWPPATRVNYGELIQARPVPDFPLRAQDGSTKSLSSLRGKWLLIQVDGSACDAACGKKLLYMRQVRLAQGKNMDRIERLWLVSDAGKADPALLREYEGTQALQAPAGMLKEFPGQAREHVYLVDPLGNLMLRFPADPDPNGMIRDLRRLLSVSRIG
jgi:hypothetical protein